jgi:hypothetical protein
MTDTIEQAEVLSDQGLIKYALRMCRTTGLGVTDRKLSKLCVEVLDRAIEAADESGATSPWKFEE